MVNLAPGALAGVVDDGYLPVVVVGGHRFVAVTDLVVYANRHARLHPGRAWVRSLVGLAARRAGVSPELPPPGPGPAGAASSRWDAPAARCAAVGARSLTRARSVRGAGVGAAT